MTHTDDQRQRIAQWITQRVQRLTSEGCPLCGSTTAGFRSGRLTFPNLDTPMLALECRNCAHVMLFNEQQILTAQR
jgi:hypothetical protein